VSLHPLVTIHEALRLLPTVTAHPKPLRTLEIICTHAQLLIHTRDGIVWILGVIDMFGDAGGELDRTNGGLEKRLLATESGLASSSSMNISMHVCCEQFL
jgi:hypothetical protein